MVFLFLFLFLFCFVLFCLVLSCLVLSCLVLSCLVLFCFVLFCFVLFVCLFFGIISHLLTRLMGSRWLDILYIFIFIYFFSFIYLFIYFGVFMDLKSISCIKTFKRSWPISSYLDRTSLVNNPCIYITFRWESRLHDLFFYSVYSMSWIWLSLWVAY